MNSFKTIFLLIALTVLLVIVGDLVGGRQGMFFFFFLALVFNLGTYWFSDKIVLKMYGAKLAPDDSRLAKLTRPIAQMAGIPMPKVYQIDAPYANAFATGRNPQHAAVCATSGILNILDDSELSGVIAHELAHIKNRDILIGTVAAVIAGAITMISRLAFFTGGGDDDNRNPYIGIIIMITAPIAAFLIQMAISRSREYTADATGASVSHNPLGLASALKKIHMASQNVTVNANPATAHMFIVNPLSGRNFASLFSTHPPVEERIARLEAMARGVGR
jgi:heat shock protein HtpX